MTSTISEPLILKTGGLGPVSTLVGRRESFQDAYERSGLFGMKFAGLHGVKYASFANRVQQLKRRRLMTQSGGHTCGALRGFPARCMRRVKPRPFSYGSTVAITSSTG